MAAATVAALSGCASLSEDGGFQRVAQLSQERAGLTPSYQRTSEQSDQARERVHELLQQPLTVDRAVEIALLNNRTLQARYADLGIAESDLVRAGRLANPSFSFGRLAGNGVVEYERAVIFDVLGLFTLPVARQVEQQRFELAQLQAVEDTLATATAARMAFFDAVAARQLQDYYGQVTDASEASHELAKRMADAGNFSKLTQMREQSFYADTRLQAARAAHRATAAREQLVRVLGLSGTQTRFTLPERLPNLPAQLPPVEEAEQRAMTQRLDVLQAKRQADATARALGLSKVTRFINVLHAGYRNKTETDAKRSNGYEIELQLPLFDFGSTRVARAEAIYQQALNQAAATAVNAQSEVREAEAARRTAYELARHYLDEVVPLRQKISEENLLRYNGMLLSVFDLLADAREQVAGVSASVEALRDFWIADSQLHMALTGRTPGALPSLAPTRAGSAAPAGH